MFGVKIRGIAMKFSIIIPTKNRTVLLDRALKSVLAQTNQNYELIVVDDGDGSGLDLARRHESAKIVTFSSESAGQVAARLVWLSVPDGLNTRPMMVLTFQRRPF